MLRRARPKKTVCLQVRTGQAEVTSPLHRLHIIDIIVTKKCPRFGTETAGDATAVQSATGV